jgi:hypothetical protein
LRHLTGYGAPVPKEPACYKSIYENIMRVHKKPNRNHNKSAFAVIFVFFFIKTAYR